MTGVFFDVALNEAANAIAIDKVSLHHSDPGAGAANELSGGLYQRKTIGYGAAAAGVRTQTADVLFDTPAGSAVEFYVLWQGTTPKRKGQVSRETFAEAGKYTLSGSTVSVENPAP